MKSFSFNQHRILKLKQQQLRLAEIVVAKVANEVAEIEQTVRVNQGNIDVLDSDFRMQSSSKAMQISQIALGMRANLEEIRHGLREKRRELSDVVSSMHKAARSFEAIKALESRAIKQYTLKRQAKEQESNDYFSTLKWNGQRRENV